MAILGAIYPFLPVFFAVLVLADDIVLDDDDIPQPAIAIGKRDNAIRRGQNRSALTAGKINSRMLCPPARKGICAVTER